MSVGLFRSERRSPTIFDRFRFVGLIHGRTISKNSIYSLLIIADPGSERRNMHTHGSLHF